MGRKSKGSSSRSKKKKRQQQRQQQQQQQQQRGSSKTSGGDQHQSASAIDRHQQHPYNFVSSAGPGCYIYHNPREGDEAEDGGPDNDWMLGVEPFHPWEFDVDVEIPEIALDPDEYTVSVTNATSSSRVCYVTVYDVVVLGRNGRALERGESIDSEGKRRDCFTFIVLCPPATFVHLCTLQLETNQCLSDVDIDSDVRDYESHPNPDDTHPQRIGFPLLCTESKGNGGFLCTQGEGGHLTHYMTGNYHAVDFRCPVGTPCVAVCDGMVVDCEDTNSLTGVAVGNLFKWNSIIIKADDFPSGDGDTSTDTAEAGPLYLEYVHIQTSSVCVKPGDKVKKGQVICKSGSVGFSPEPHLHFSAFRSNEPTAPTVRVWLQPENGEEEEPFIPRAGLYYNENGLVKT